MSHTTQVREHGVVLALQELGETLREEWPADDTVRDCIDRVRWVRDTAEARLQATDPRGVIPSTLGALHSAVSRMQNAASALQQGTNDSYVQQAHTACDEALSATATWAPSRTVRAVATATAVAEEFRKDADRHLSDLESRVSELRSTAEAAITQHETQANDITRDAEAALAKATTQETRVDQALNDLQTRYQAAEDKRVEAATTAAKERTDEASVTIAAIEEAGARSRNDLREKATEFLEELATMRQQARNTLQAIGVDATASQYGSYANQQRKAAFFWNVVAVLLGVGAAASLLFVLQSATQVDVSWPLMSLKTIIGTVLVAVAGYAGAQARGHRHEERRARRLELGLAALDPFLANVDQAEVSRLRLALGAELFAGAGDRRDAGDAVGPLATLQSHYISRVLKDRQEGAAPAAGTAAK